MKISKGYFRPKMCPEAGSIENSTKHILLLALLAFLPNSHAAALVPFPG